MEVYLEAERLVLRRFTSGDAQLLYELDNDPDVMHFINLGAPVPRAEVVDIILPAFLSHYQRVDGFGFWAAIEKKSGR